MTRSSMQFDEGSALEQLRAWLIAGSIPEDQALEVVQRVADFHANAFGLLDFPPAIGIGAASQGMPGVSLELIWPEALGPSERASFEASLRETFEREVRAPLMPAVPCHLTFTDALPTDERAYPCYLGPSVRGYQAFAAKFVETKRGLAKSPALAQELAAAVQRFLESPKGQSRALAQEIAQLMSQLRSS